MSFCKKIVFLFLTLLIGCVDHPSYFEKWASDDGKIKILTTTGMIGNLVQEIGKEKVDCLVLIHGQIDPHSYELVKGDDEKLERADLIFYNGLGLEHGASLSYFLSQAPHACSIGDIIKEDHPEKIFIH